MKLLFICGAGIVSGKEVVTLELMTQLNAEHNILCLTSNWGSKRFRDLLTENDIRFEKMRIGFISKTLSFSAIRMTLVQMLYMPWLYIKYNYIVSKFRPNVIVHTNFHHLFLLYPFLNNNQKHFYYAHEFYSNNNFYKKLFRLFNKKINKFIAVSEATKRGLMEAGIDSSKITVIYNGLNFNNTAASNKYISDNHLLRIGIVGQVGGWKGHEDLIDALIILKSENIFVKCLIFGEGSEEFTNHLKSKISKSELVEYVQWMGYESDKNKIYNQIDVCCVVSKKQDPLPTSAIEAGFYNKPVIATDVGGLPEIIINNKTGLLVNPNNSNEIARALRYFNENRNMIDRMGKNAFSYVSEKFTSEKMKNSFISLLEEN